MTTRAPLPPLAEPYLSDFATIERMLARAPGFTLQPIEAHSPDLAHAFAGWLRARSWAPELLVVRDDESLDRLAKTLTRPDPTPQRVVLVIAAAEFEASSTYRGLTAVNWVRDRIAESTGCPVLWWGKKTFHLMTWEHAPDLWSIAGLPYRIQVRRLVDLAEQLPLSLRGRLELLKHEPPPGGDSALGDTIPHLRARIEEVRGQSGLTRTRFYLHLRLAEALEVMNDPACVQEYGLARSITRELGDTASTLEIDFYLVFYLWSGLDEELRAAIQEFSVAVRRRSADRKVVAITTMIQAHAAMNSQDFTRAEALALEGVQHAAAAQQPSLRLATYPILAVAALELGDFPGCLARTSEWIAIATELDDMRAILRGRVVRARARERLGELIGAAHELQIAILAADMLRATGTTGPLFLQLSGLARRVGDDDVATYFSVLGILLSPHGQANEAWTELRDGTSRTFQESAELAAKAARYRASAVGVGDVAGQRAREQLVTALQRFVTNLNARGVEPLNPDSWRVRVVAG